jgi:hypothetical protein
MPWPLEVVPGGRAGRLRRVTYSRWKTRQAGAGPWFTRTRVRGCPPVSGAQYPAAGTGTADENSADFD